MIDDTVFETCVARAALAPTVHNTQPARWVRDGAVLSLFCDTNVGLPVADPTGFQAGLSCGAVLEAMVLALSAEDIGVVVSYTGLPTQAGQGLVAVAHLTLAEGSVDVLHEQLENRFTWRGAFENTPPALFGWTRPDARLVTDRTSKEWLAEQNDWASHQIMQHGAFRQELLSWMRLQATHPRAGLDGMDRLALMMTPRQARVVPFVFGAFWRVLSLFGRTKGLVAEAGFTSQTPVIALFHRDIHENPVVSGRAYLRMCLEAASLGFAGWPMAALTDHPAANDALRDRFGIASDRRLIQAIRFGTPVGIAPPRARRPMAEILR